MLDPIADKVLLSGAFVALWLDGSVEGWLAAIILGRDALILGAAGVALVWSKSPRRFPPSIWGKLSTIAQVALVVTLAARIPEPVRASSNGPRDADRGKFLALCLALYSKLMRAVLIFLAAAALLAGDYTAEIAKFRAEREKSLVREDGWTTVVGLSWLRGGDNRAGSDPKSDVPLPALLPAQVGVFTLHSGHVRFQPSRNKPAGQGVETGQRRCGAGNGEVFPDPKGRGQNARFGVRIKDSDAATRKEFTHLSWYPVDPSWRIVPNTFRGTNRI